MFNLKNTLKFLYEHSKSKNSSTDTLKTLLGIVETFAFITSVAQALSVIADFVAHIFDVDKSLEPLISLAFLCFSMSINVIGGRLFWYVCSFTTNPPSSS